MGTALGPPSARADGGPASPVVALNAGLLSVMRSGKATPFARRYAQLAPVVKRCFDLDTILRVSAGSAWARLPPADQAALAAAFQTFTVASYVANFDADDGTRFDVAGARPSGADSVVQTAIVSPKGESNRIDYVVRTAGGEARIVDVLLDGSISRVAVQRSDFRGLLAAGGARPLLDSLAAKTAELSGGAAL